MEEKRKIGFFVQESFVESDQSSGWRGFPIEPPREICIIIANKRAALFVHIFIGGGLVNYLVRVIYLDIYLVAMGRYLL